MTSAWWLLVAFVGGGSAGILLMALMQLAGGLPAQQTNAQEGRSETIQFASQAERTTAWRRTDNILPANCHLELERRAIVTIFHFVHGLLVPSE